MRTTLLSLLFLFFVSCSFGQAPALQWQKSMGGSEEELVSTILRTPDTGYLVMGYTTSFDGDITGKIGPWSPWLIKFSGSGSIQWSKVLGDSNLQTAICMKPTLDGNYVFTGFFESASAGTPMDLLLVKIDDTGRILWTKTYGGSGDDYSQYVLPTRDSGYIIAAQTDYGDGDVTGVVHIDSVHHSRDVWIVKVNDTGGIQWQKTIGGLEEDNAYSIKQTADGGYIFAGHTESTDGDLAGVTVVGGFWVVKLSDTGRIEWQKEFAGSTAGAIELTTDGGYIVAGTTSSTNGDCLIIKLDSTGAVLWQKTYGGTGSDGANSIRETLDGGYIVGASSDSHDGDVTGNHGASDIWVFNISASGNLLWQKSLGGSGLEGTSDIALSPDGTMALCGSTTSSDGDLTSHRANYDYWVVRLAVPSSVGTIASESVISLVPNPTKGEIHVSGIKSADIIVCNVLGQLVQKAEATNIISIADCPPGMYFVRVFGNEHEVLYSGSVIRQ